MMKKYVILLICFMLPACAQDPYRLKISSTLGSEHGKSIYFSSVLRSPYAGKIRGVLSKKFGESGMRTATSAQTADFIGVFDIETFYKPQEGQSKTYFKSSGDDAPLFAVDENGAALSFYGNSDMDVDSDKTCFTLKIGKKDTSDVRYSSSFCADEVMEAEEMVPLIISIYGKYANYQSANVGVQCFNSGEQADCDTMHDRQQAFINSLWMDKEIADE